MQFIGGLQGSCSKPIRVNTEFPAIPFKSICPLDGNICISFNNYSKGFAKWNCFLYIRQFWFFFAFRVIQGVKIGSGLGVTSEKNPDDLKTYVKKGRGGQAQTRNSEWF